MKTTATTRTRLKYKEMISQSELQIQEAELQHKVESAASQLQMDMSATRLAVSQAKQQLSKVMLQATFSSQAIINAQDKITDLENGLKRLEQLNKELF